MNTADNHLERCNWRYLPKIARSLLRSHDRCHLAVEVDVEQCAREQSAVSLSQKFLNYQSIDSLAHTCVEREREACRRDKKRRGNQSTSRFFVRRRSLLAARLRLKTLLLSPYYTVGCRLGAIEVMPVSAQELEIED